MSNPIFISSPFDDPELLAAVTGLADRPLHPASIGGLRGGTLDLEGSGALRLEYWAGVFGQAPVAVALDDGAGPVTAYLPLPDAPVLRADGRWPAILRHAAPEIMSYFATRSVKDVAGRLNMILSRADARVLAQLNYRAPESGLDRNDIRIVEHRRPYSEFFVLEEYIFSHTRFDGTESEVVNRAAMVVADAVTVLPYDPVRDCVLLVEQVRVAPLARGDRSPWLLEPVAGRIEPGDTPEATAHKESQEEAGLKLSGLLHVADYYPSTGCFSEFVYSYIGIADLPDTAAGLGGVLGEGEDIRGHILSRATLMDRIRAGDMPDAPLLISAFWLEANLSQVRGFG